MTRLVAALLLLAVLGGMAPMAASAAEYRLETQATYEVRPDDRLIQVTVNAALTNTTPDPDGQFSVFSEVKFAVHDGAAAVSASDGDGALEVTVREERSVNVATVALRDDLRFEQTADVALRYQLRDTESTQLRVRQSVVVFPAWGFGTASNVTVRIPDDYEIRLDGNELAATSARGMTTLTSGHIDAPASWLALVTATASGATETRTASVPLTGGTVDLQVEAFGDDAAWADRTISLLERALPLIEERLGLPYSHVGPLMVTESVAGVGDVEVDDGSRIVLAYDAPPFTAVRRVTEVWLQPDLISDTWIREGLAAHVAATVAGELDIAAPYDPAAATEARAAAAFQLAEWPAAAPPEASAYGEAASWMLVDEIERQVEGEVIPLVLSRAAAGIGAYAPAGSASPELSGEAAQPLDSRSFLDQLDTVGGTDLSARFGEVVLGAEDAALLPARAEALASVRGLQMAARDWGAPDPVLAAMRTWDFEDARAQADAARDWMTRRDDLLDRISELGLAAPIRLQQAYRTDGGGSEAVTELDAELAVVEAYGAGLDAVNAPRSLIERIGLVGGPAPEAGMASANGLFADGDLAGAAAAIGEADRLIANAEMSGALRLASLAAALALVVAAIVVLVRRRRSAAPA
jgi:hypothetical protein